MTETKDKESQDSSTIEKLKILKDILSVAVPIDEQPNYGEYNKYQPAFDPAERYQLKSKIMELVKTL